MVCPIVCFCLDSLCLDGSFGYHREKLHWNWWHRHNQPIWRSKPSKEKGDVIIQNDYDHFGCLDFSLDSIFDPPLLDYVWKLAIHFGRNGHCTHTLLQTKCSSKFINIWSEVSNDTDRVIWVNIAKISGGIKTRPRSLRSLSSLSSLANFSQFSGNS